MRWPASYRRPACANAAWPRKLPFRAGMRRLDGGGWEAAAAAGEAEEGDDKSTMQAGGNRVR